MINYLHRLTINFTTNKKKKQIIFKKNKKNICKCYKNPKSETWFLHIVHGQFSNLNFFTSVLNSDKVGNSLIFSGNKLHIFGPQYLVEFKP